MLLLARLLAQLPPLPGLGHSCLLPTRSKPRSDLSAFLPPPARASTATDETTQGGVPTSAGCVTCATTHFIDAASGLCTRCPHPSMASTPSTGGVANAQLAPNSGGGPGVGSCACPSATHTQVPQLFAEDTCFFTESDVYKAAATAVTTGASQLTYPAGALSGATDKGAGKLVRTEAAIGPVTSRAFTLLFLPSAAACNSKALADNSATLPAQADATRACQAVGNLCVLNRYQNGGVCDAYKALVQEPLATNSIPGWPAMMPWIYYTQDRGAVFGSLPIGMKVGVKSRRGLEPDAGVVTRLSFVLSSWTMNGTWLGYVSEPSLCLSWLLLLPLFALH